MKNFGLLLLTLGVAISAMNAARTTETRGDRLSTIGRSSIVGAGIGGAQAAYCREASKFWNAALASGCDPSPAKAHASQVNPTTCARAKAYRVVALVDGCKATHADPMAFTDRVAYGLLTYKAPKIANPNHVGVYRENTAPWKASDTDHDRFLELEPSGNATLYTLDRITERRTVIARGTQQRAGQQLKVEVCGVDAFADVGCSTSLFGLGRNLLQLVKIKLPNARMERPRHALSYAHLVNDKETVKKYNQQLAALAVVRDAARRGRGIKLPPDMNKARAVWLSALTKGIGAKTEKAGLSAPSAPGTRLGDWFSSYGLQFLLGLALIVVGGVMSRKAIRRQAESEPAAGSPEAVDFGEILSQLGLQVAAHAEEMTTIAEPDPSQFDRFKSFIDDVKVATIERLVESRGRVQVRYGIEGYAAVFGPLSRGERYLNRAWSALVDLHWPEASTSMKTAAGALSDAHGELMKLVAARDAMSAPAA